MTETELVEMRPSFARELTEILELEVEEADEYHSTEQAMEEVAGLIRDVLDGAVGSPDIVTVKVRRALASEMAEILEDEVKHADEYKSTEQVMKEGAMALRQAL